MSIAEPVFPNLQFLKLGGSLITDKNRPQTARAEVLERLAEEIALARQQQPDLRLVLGHGSGSFGHVPAQRYGTRQGVHTSQEWLGFVEVWRAAGQLNRLVVDACLSVDLPVLAFAPSACIQAEDGMVAAWNLEPLKRALQAGLIPLVFGDVVFDRQRGGTILSTEDLFAFLAKELRPRRVLLAGQEAGVYGDFPACTQLLPLIHPADWAELSHGITGSAAMDVTGGMRSKVEHSLALVQANPDLEVCIFSGEQPGLVLQALCGAAPGTVIRND